MFACLFGCLVFFNCFVFVLCVRSFVCLFFVSFCFCFVCLKNVDVHYYLKQSTLHIGQRGKHTFHNYQLLSPSFTKCQAVKPINATFNPNLPAPVNFVPFGTMRYSPFDINLISTTCILFIYLLIYLHIWLKTAKSITKVRHYINKIL